MNEPKFRLAKLVPISDLPLNTEDDGWAARLCRDYVEETGEQGQWIMIATEELDCTVLLTAKSVVEVE